ncbi:MAG: histidine--tRNA ligase [Elusimicrobia bacterium]|nr:histidine--tRNA ligase [Elusimicrobiota bacterium]
MRPIHSLRGFRDILPPESGLFSKIETTAREMFASYGYREIRIPTLELKELFVKSTGDTTDIVEKEMYAFEDQGKRMIAARPEGTPGVVRAYIENNLSQSGKNSKFYYIGSMFRAERPQAGRYREFTQIGVENLGNPSPFADAETITVLVRFLEKTGISGCSGSSHSSLHLGPQCGCSVEINSMGCAKCRSIYRENLLSYLKANSGDLCDSCKSRIDRNPLRALDCKTDGPVFAEKAPGISMCAECEEHFKKTGELLKISGIFFKLNPHLVRGIDYYTRTVFEVKSSALGSQDAIAGGGRYDDLVKSMGGPATPAVGWAMGLDRLVLAIKEVNPAADSPEVFVAAADKNSRIEAFRILTELRDYDIKADSSDFDASLKSQMRSADKSDARLAIIIGEEEVRSSTCIIKFLKEKLSQKTVVRNNLLSELKLILKPAVTDP